MQSRRHNVSRIQQRIIRSKTLVKFHGKAKGAFVSENALHSFDGDKPNSVAPRKRSRPDDHSSLPNFSESPIPQSGDRGFAFALIISTTMGIKAEDLGITADALVEKVLPLVRKKSKLTPSV